MGRVAGAGQISDWYNITGLFFCFVFHHFFLFKKKYLYQNKRKTAWVFDWFFFTEFYRVSPALFYLFVFCNNLFSFGYRDRFYGTDVVFDRVLPSFTEFRWPSGPQWLFFFLFNFFLNKFGYRDRFNGTDVVFDREEKSKSDFFFYRILPSFTEFRWPSGPP